MFSIVFDKLRAKELRSKMGGPVIIKIWYAARGDVIRTRGETGDTNGKSVKGRTIVIGGNDTLHIKIDQKELVSVVKEGVSIISGSQKEKFLIQHAEGAGLKPQEARMEGRKFCGRRERERSNFVLRIFNKVRKLKIKDREIRRKRKTSELTIVSTSGVQIE